MIRADLYKVFHRPFFYFLLAGMSALALLVNFSISRLSAGNTVYNSWMVVLAYFLSWPVLLMPVLVDLVGAEEFKEHTLKNSVSFGLNRTKLYCSQVTVSVILGILVGAVALGAYCGSSLLLLKQDPSFTGAFAADFFRRVGVSCIGYAAAIPIAAFLAMMLQKNSLFVFAFYAVIYLPQLLLNLFHLSGLSKYFLLMPQFNLIAAGTPGQMTASAAVFAATAVFFVMIGAVFFRKKDIC
ncbi:MULTISPECIES: ABC transporter permease [Acutalibacteraceae]|uniref:ABC transporter permease n=1 Tax=Acutalibacteraceae TaxID=3082771 RepID=UPI001FAA8833|nr:MULTISPECIES: ABC transporter permease [Acutalibacteraceae]